MRGMSPHPMLVTFSAKVSQTDNIHWKQIKINLPWNWKRKLLAFSKRVWKQAIIHIVYIYNISHQQLTYIYFVCINFKQAYINFFHITKKSIAWNPLKSFVYQINYCCAGVLFQKYWILWFTKNEKNIRHPPCCWSIHFWKREKKTITFRVKC